MQDVRVVSAKEHGNVVAEVSAGKSVNNRAGGIVMVEMANAGEYAVLLSIFDELTGIEKAVIEVHFESEIKRAVGVALYLAQAPAQVVRAQYFATVLKDQLLGLL